MADYAIHRSDGVIITIPQDQIYQELYNPAGGGTGTGGVGVGIQLVGQNAVSYGAPIAQTFLQLTENFASVTNTQPKGKFALEGQLWYDKSLDNLYVRITPGTADGNDVGPFSANWQQVVTIGGSGTSGLPIINPAVPKAGDIQVLTGPTRISIYGGGTWNQVFPAIAVYG